MWTPFLVSSTSASGQVTVRVGHELVDDYLHFLSGRSRPNSVLSVTEPMCNDCNGFFRRLSIHRGKVQVVTDPHGTWIFRPDGQIEFLAMGEP